MRLLSNISINYPFLCPILSTVLRCCWIVRYPNLVSDIIEYFQMSSSILSAPVRYCHILSDTLDYHNWLILANILFQANFIGVLCVFLRCFKRLFHDCFIRSESSSRTRSCRSVCLSVNNLELIIQKVSEQHNADEIAR